MFADCHLTLPLVLALYHSNAINNSAEAFGDNQGLIEVILNSNKDKISLTVSDDGKGIPPHILAKLGQKGVTHGKEGTQSGSGLGVYHAKKTIESFGGNYEIQSPVAQGTSVIITLQKEVPPNWFVQKILLNKNQSVVVTDDDNSILQIWQERFSNFVNSDRIKLFTCSNGNCLVDWLSKNKAIAPNTSFLMDYELIGQKNTGLDLIEALGIGPQSILVSSRFEEPKIRERCSKLNVRMIPKGMASLVEINLQNEDQSRENISIRDDSPISQVSLQPEINAKFRPND